jgi:hypothetical protein
VASGCQKEEPGPLEPVSFALDGSWDLQSMLSERPVDLDFDRSYSNDLLKEMEHVIKFPSKNNDYHMLFESRPIEPSKEFPSGYYQIISFFHPVPTVLLDAEDKYLTTNYGLTNHEIIVWYSERKNELLKTSDEVYGKYSILNELRINEDKIITIIYEQDYHTEIGWENLKITATYQKRQGQ